MNNFLKINDFLIKIIDLPFFKLAQSVQEDSLNDLTIIIQGLLKLAPNGRDESELYKKIQSLADCLPVMPFNELYFVETYRDILKIIAIKSDEFIYELTLISRIIERARPFWLALEAQKTKQESWAPEKIIKEDKKIIKEMQIYALDYFLYIYKQMQSLPVGKKLEVVITKYEKMPSLREDILGEDMLKNMVYGITDTYLFERMANDYYDLKKTLLFLDNKTGNNVLEFEAALRDYCVALMKICLEHGYDRSEDGLHYPYGQNTGYEEIINKLIC